MSEEAKKANEETKQQISKFISSVSDKNYAEANKYLQGVVEDKIQNRINNATEKPLF